MEFNFLRQINKIHHAVFNSGEIIRMFKAAFYSEVEVRITRPTPSATHPFFFIFGLTKKILVNAQAVHVGRPHK